MVDTNRSPCIADRTDLEGTGCNRADFDIRQVARAWLTEITECKLNSEVILKM